MKVTYKGLPRSTSVTLSGSKKIAVKITNKGAAPEDFFLDPRLSATAARAAVRPAG